MCMHSLFRVFGSSDSQVGLSFVSTCGTVDWRTISRGKGKGWGLLNVEFRLDVDSKLCLCFPQQPLAILLSIHSIHTVVREVVISKHNELQASVSESQLQHFTLLSYSADPF